MASLPQWVTKVRRDRRFIRKIHPVPAQCSEETTKEEGGDPKTAPEFR
jgi:hypothetical protein